MRALNQERVTIMPVRALIGAFAALCAVLAVSVAVAPTASAAGPLHLDPEQFQLTDFHTSASDTLAGGHPDVNATFELKHEEVGPFLYMPFGRTKRVEVDLPYGLVANPTNFPACSLDTFMEFSLIPGQGCPTVSQVGIADATVSALAPIGWYPVFLLEHGPDEPVLLGVKFSTALYAYVHAEVQPDGRLTAFVENLPVSGPLVFSSMTLWGVPADHSGSGEPRRPFVTAPTECESVPTTNLRVSSYEGREDSAVSTDPIPTECDKVPFEPAVSLKATSRVAGAPTGLDVRIDLPQSNLPDERVSAHVKGVKVELPEGMTVSPSAANGLGACSAAEFGYRTHSEIRCPDASKIGSVSVETPVLEVPLRGDVYLAKQYDNPFDSLMALYMVVRGAGITHKLAGRVDPDPVTGQLTTTFSDNPQLPWNRLDVSIKSGPRAPLVNPRTCGTHTAKVQFTSWARHQVDRTSPMMVDEGCGPLGFNPSFEAGTSNPGAAVSSPFSMWIVRPDGDEEVKSVQQVKMPEGLLGDVSSVELCDEASASLGTCGEGSRVGRVEVAAGAGSLPVWVPQAGKDPTRVHLTGPYRGAPYGLSIVVPAQAGPFDLGRVVVRTALHIDERTAQITSGVDESRVYGRNGQLTEVIEGALPRIVEGVVLDQREIRVIVDREGFMINPTNCSQQQITTHLHGFAGSTVDVGSSFRAADCARLGFAPKLNARILDKGRKSTLRSWHPRTRFTVVPRKGDANIGGARVALPSSTILDQSNIGTTCTRVQMAARDCPAKSLVGYAKAWSPLLRKAVEGPVYLAANGGVRPLPDIAAVLDGEIRVVLQGEVSTLRTGGKARLQNTFRVVPDAPVTRFVLTMRGGKNTGLLVNSTDLCRTNERGVAVFNGQNGRSHRMNLRVGLSFKGCAKARRQVAKRRVARKAAARTAAANRIAKAAQTARGKAGA